jgi:hypothetical protein
MKLGISKKELPAMIKALGYIISGMGIGMFLAIVFVPKDDRGKLFHFGYVLAAWILILVGSVVKSSFQQNVAKGDLTDK